MKNQTTNSKSTASDIPLPDNHYMGSWLGYSVSIPMEGYEIRFNTVKSIGNRNEIVDVLMSGGVAFVEVKK